MATPVPADPAPNYVFSDEGPWHAVSLHGGVYHVPEWIRNLIVVSIHAQWVSSYDNGDEHTVGRLTYHAAMLSMEPNDYSSSTDIVPGVLPILTCGTDFVPGIFSLKMLPYATKTNRSGHTREYRVMRGATVGQFINSIVNRHMDQFLFEMYTHRDAKKGCGHFAVRAYQVWLQDNLITDAKSVEEPHNTFPMDITYTYLPDGRFTPAAVGLGRFLHLTDPTIDEPNELVPDEIWSRAVSRASRVLEGRDVDAENAAAENAAACPI